MAFDRAQASSAATLCQLSKPVILCTITTLFVLIHDPSGLPRPTSLRLGWAGVNEGWPHGHVSDCLFRAGKLMASPSALCLLG